MIKEKIETVKVREYDGFYCERKAKSGLLGFLCAPKSYKAWAADNVIEPDLYDVVSFICLGEQGRSTHVWTSWTETCSNSYTKNCSWINW